MVHDRVVRQPARHRLVVRLERSRAARRPPRAGPSRSAAAATTRRPELLIARSKPRLQRSLQDTAAASFGPVPFDGPEAAQLLAAVPRPLREAAARGRPPHRPASCRRCDSRPRGRRQHGHRVHLRPRRVRRLARAARQGRGRLRGGDPRAADRQGPARRARRAPPEPRAPSSPRASTSRRCC